VHFKIYHVVGDRNSELIKFIIPKPSKKTVPLLLRKLGKLMHGVCGGVSVCDDHGVGIVDVLFPSVAKERISSAAKKP
jgi:hypothetical protein